MVVTRREDARPEEVQVGLGKFVLDAVLSSYSQILFSRNRATGVLLIGATFMAPIPAAFGLVSVVLAMITARLFKFSPDSVRSGLFSYNALLVGLGLGALYQPSPALFALAVVAAVLAVIATATMNSAIGAMFNLPSLTLPFLFVFYVVTSFAHHIKGVQFLPDSYSPLLEGEHLPHVVASYLKSLGALFFLPRVDAGVLVLAALLFNSRIAFVLSLLGFAVAYPLSLHMVAVPDAHLHLMMGYNLVLVAVALGGVWFVPGVTSFIFALCGVAVAATLTLAGYYLLVRLGLALLILPFNLTVIPMLYAMRQRVRDGSPKAVDWALGTPEQNLNYYQTRMARFGYLYHVRFCLPFMGRWVCTQGNNGPHTHKDHWRHGFDFEVEGPDGARHKSGGAKLEDHYCFRLPIVAPADGTVVKVVDGIPDNKPGEVNTRENWGNLVLTYHGIGLYSMVAHLAKGSVKVKEGEVVRRGDPLGVCGNSGRSPVPHVHFQLQGTERIGAPTIEAAFHEIVEVGEDSEKLHATRVPEEGDVLRNLEPEQDLRRLFSFPLGEEFTLRCTSGPGKGSEETIEAVIDLYGALSLENRKKNAVLYFENKFSGFTVYDYLGPSSSVLSLVNLALPRVPFEPGRQMTWTDHLVSRHFYSWGRRVLRDLVSPFLGLGGLEMEYSMKRDGMEYVVSGRSRLTFGAGAPLLETRAVLVNGRGLMELEICMKGKKRSAGRVERDGKQG